MNEEENSNQSQINNNDDYVQPNVLELRLNTDQVLTRIEAYLRGEIERTKIGENGIPQYYTDKVCEAKANHEGIHSIMSWVSSMVNPQVVQGNISTFEEHIKFISNFRMDLAEYVMKNLYNWAIRDEDFEGLIDMITNQIRFFTSRLVDNKERDSYANTLRHVESAMTRERSRRMQMPGFAPRRAQ